MKKVVLNYLAIVVMFFAIAETSCNKKKETPLRVITMTTSKSEVTFIIRTYENLEVDWGDGNIERDLEDDLNSEREFSHTYSSTNEHTITISGLISPLSFKFV